MGDRVKLKGLYRRHMPSPSGDIVDRAVQLIVFCGDIYRDLQQNHRGAPWTPELAGRMQRRIARAVEALGLEQGSVDLGNTGYAFGGGHDIPFSYWGYSNRVLECCAAARAAQLGHLEDVLMAGSLLSNGFREWLGDEPTPVLPDGYCTLLPTVAIMAAPLEDVLRLAEIDILPWFDGDGEDNAVHFEPAFAVLRPDVDPETRQLLLQGVAPALADALLAVRASLGLPLEDDEVRGDMRALTYYMDYTEENDPDADLGSFRDLLCMIYLAARDVPLMLEPPTKDTTEALEWVNDWYGHTKWPPFPSKRDPELPRLPIVPSTIPVSDRATAVSAAAALMAASHYEQNEPDEARAWAMIAAGMSMAPGYLTLAQLALDAGDDEATAYWAIRGLTPSTREEGLRNLEEPADGWEDADPDLHLLAAVSLAKLNRSEESAVHLVAAAEGGNSTAQTILDAMLKQAGGGAAEG